MDAASVAACVDVLESVSGSSTSDEADPEVLLALMVLGLAHPAQVENQGVSAVACGRRVASRHEQAGNPDAALAVIEILRETHPEHPALERDYEAILRRLGMVQDLADRYLTRAHQLIKQGKKDEAAGWLREVMLLDRSRKDVARLIRDLRLEKENVHGTRPRVSKLVLLALAVPVALAAAVMREQRLVHEFDALPHATTGDLPSMRSRLDALELFVADTPVWHGAFQALSERTKLRVDVNELETAAQLERERQEAAQREVYERADVLRRRARMNAEVGDFASALSDYRASLQDAPPEWEHRERVERDIEAISKLLAESQGEDKQ